jgi:tRNA (guanine37-N1)-methyltransferase
VIYHIVSSVPDFYKSFLATSIIKRAIDNKLIKVKVYNLRKYSLDKRGSVDGTPYGGGAGMILLVEPVIKVVDDIRKSNTNIPVVLFSAKGKTFNQELAKSYSTAHEVILICPRFEGFDERIISLSNAVEVSLGNFVIMGGDTAAMIFIEATSRLVPNVLKNPQSIVEESFNNGTCEYPQYSKPQTFRNLSVPNELLSGNHQKILSWRKKESKKIDRAIK